MREIVWTLAASVELQGVFARLQEHRDGLGTEFVLEINRSLELVQAHPLLGSSYEPPARKLLVWKCQYGLIYVPEARGIVVLALAHLGQNPDSLRQKIRRLLRLE